MSGSKLKALYIYTHESETATEKVWETGAGMGVVKALVGGGWGADKGEGVSKSCKLLYQRMLLRPTA